MKTRLLAALLMICTGVSAREWTSADGKKTVDALFVAVQGEKLVLSTAGKPSAFPLAAFSPDDQQFAKNAQAIADASAKLGPQAYEFAHPVEDGSGWICRLALPADPKSPGPRLFTGETVFLVTRDVFAHQKGQRVEKQLLFGAGGRTYHPLAGDPAMVRAFALDAEHATQIWSDVMAASGGDVAKQAPNVLEPDVEIASRIGFGVVIGKNGLIAIDPDLAKKGFKALVVHHDGKDFPATLFLPKDKDGADLKLPDIALVTAEVPVEPARIGTRKNTVVGQSIFALGYELNASKKGLYNRATVTRGIVSRFGSGGSFQHDARIPPENVGGFILGEKSDVLGFFFQTQATGRTSTRGSSSEDKGDAAGLGTCISTQSIATLLEKMPGQTGLRSGSVTDDMEAAGKELLASVVLAVATFEINKPRKIAPPPTAAATMPPGTDPPPAGWSLSRTGTRHNSKCKFYNASYPCPATEGKACKVCGG